MSSKNNNELSPKLLYATKLAVVVLVLSSTGLFIYFFQPSWFKFNLKKSETSQPVSVTATSSAPLTCTDCVRRLLDGEMVAPELAKLRPYAVMIDNFPAARPESGLSAASLVYEAPVEGGITRYLAFFTPDKAPSEIGPIRSARSYFLNWAKEASATYVHVGGSAQALDLAKNLGTSNLDEFFKGSYFWRSDSRMTPHNVLSSADNLNKYRISSGESGPDLIPWQFKDALASGTPIISQIKIKYPTGYAIYWQYQENTNDYVRYQDNALYLDANSQKVIAKNIIVHLASFKVVDDKLRLEMANDLSGQALLCQDGNCKLGVWKKNSSTSRAKYYDKKGLEFTFNAGNTWIEVIDNLNILEY
ncbi:MAG: DUF3048 domain-containing protein [Candidatus Falkowbacteria bacterium]